MWLNLIIAPIWTSTLAAYSIVRLPTAPEAELIGVNLLFLLFMLFPILRSKLLRRRTFVNAWFKENHWLRELLQGGAIYLFFQVLLILPFAFLFLLELQHISIDSWLLLVPLSFVSALCQKAFYVQLSKSLKPIAASVLSREWATYCFMFGCILIFAQQILYTPHPDLSDRSLQEALLFAEEQSHHKQNGFIGDLIFFSTLKDTAFWWLLMKIPTVLTELPQVLTWLLQLSLSSVYFLYQLSIAYAFSRCFAGALEFADREFYQFISGSASRQPSQEVEEIK